MDAGIVENTDTHEYYLVLKSTQWGSLVWPLQRSIFRQRVFFTPVMHEETRSEWKHWKGVGHLQSIPVQYLPPAITQVLVGEGSATLGTG
eukprot:4848660-Amphidinium_carterae.1